MSAVGALAPGHLLISPVEHTESVRRLAPGRRPAFLDFTRRVQQRLEHTYGPLTVFEHGSCGRADQRRSACVAHPHIQLLPGRYGFGRLPLPVTSFDSLDNLFAATTPAGDDQGYLLYQEPGGMACLAADVGVSQFFRRHVAELIGEPDDWDYALFPRWENVRATHRDLLGAGVREASR
ncbi:hypothetical protein HH310_29045 [Actinoplanes sp. TBRC 11911]|uniref:hypothetical protein n=1 Tax=Actinoplanes sp. TBRC 11911 TaxID=2729386 RepID=UPI00145C9A4C|nr:hypothetical protein [Actinoplanes sp. TBRC 11911]NMO55219.1 hypothetical protein [Actinoplanes sp. TBRC 11911]